MKKPIPFGRYVLLERINVGGMAEVFKAKALGADGFERLIAVKRILPSIAEDREFIAMFLDEAKIGMQLTHANIAQVFDLGRIGDSYFIAMEYVHGTDLRAIADRARKRGEILPVAMACYVAMKVCEGLDYAHNKKDATGRELNIVHRDVSPQNILISYDGECKIIDFGFMKAAEKAGQAYSGILRGKLGYMSPEQARGLPLDRRSDIFAVGVLLYELLTGERLFVGESDSSTLDKVRNVEVVTPSAYNRGIPSELEQIVLKALAKDADDRYRTAMELHDDLQSFMYTSGNFFSRKDLSAYMRKAFSEEIARESQREVDDRRREAEVSQSSGLDAFAHLAPTRAARPASTTGPGPSASTKTTTLDVGAAFPPPPPRAGGPHTPLPPPHARAAPAPHPSQRAAAADAALDMDWDDDELATQIYDKPEDEALPGLEELSKDASFPSPSSAADPSGPSFTPPPKAAAPSTAPSSPGLATGAPPTFADSLVPNVAPPVGAEPTASTRVPARGSSGGRRASALVGLAGVLLVAAGATGVWYFALRTKPGTIHLTTMPPDAVVYLDGQRAVTSTSSPFVLTHVDPGEHVVEVRREGYATWATPVRLGSGETLALPTITLVPQSGTTPPTQADIASVPAPIGTGFRLDTRPSGATVYVDDRPLSDTTPVIVTDLAPGLHTIRAELPHYAPWTGQIELEANQIVQLPRAVLTLREVSVRFESTPPGAHVTLVRGSERRNIGETPVTHVVDVSGGAWTVEMTLAGHEDWTAPLTLPSDQPEHAVTATLVEQAPQERARVARAESAPSSDPQPAPHRRDRPGRGDAPSGGGMGTLRVNTTPWSQVFVDGRLIGNTPQMNIPLPAGRHTITLVNPRYNINERVPVTIRAGQTETLIRTLTPGG